MENAYYEKKLCRNLKFFCIKINILGLSHLLLVQKEAGIGSGAGTPTEAI